MGEEGIGKMFGALIRRREKPLNNAEDAAFDSTRFTLSTSVPRPDDRRGDDRMPTTLRVVKVRETEGGREQLIRLRNVSAGGLMAEVSFPVSIGTNVTVEFNGQWIPATVVWTREGTAGFKFEQDLDLGELLAGRKARHGFRARPPRLDVDCKASVRVGKTYYTVDVRDISLGGLKVEPISEYCLGKDVIVVVESLRPIKGEVRWYSDRKAGIVFKKPLEFEELAEWVGKRLEMAALKASYRQG